MGLYYLQVFFVRKMLVKTFIIVYTFIYMSKDDKKSQIDSPPEEEIIQEEDVSFVEEDETETNSFGLSASEKVKKLKQELLESKKERAEYLAGWQKSRAEYANLKKEEELKRIGLKQLYVSESIEDLFPTLDSFEMAFKNKESWEKVDATWRKGIEYIYQQFMTFLEDRNVQNISETGVLFDPKLHEAFEHIPIEDKDKDNIIESIVQTGYKIGDRIIRPAKVKVYVLQIVEENNI